MKIEHIYPSKTGSEKERKARIQSAYTDIQKMIYNERQAKKAKVRKENV